MKYLNIAFGIAIVFLLFSAVIGGDWSQAVFWLLFGVMEFVGKMVSALIDIEKFGCIQRQKIIDLLEKHHGSKSSTDSQ